MSGADNFAIAFYAAGAKAPIPLRDGLMLPLTSSSTLVNHEQDTRAVRRKLKKMTNDEFLAFCQDEFPEVAIGLADEQSRARKKSYLIDHCVRKPDEWDRIMDLLARTR